MNKKVSSMLLHLVLAMQASFAVSWSPADTQAFFGVVHMHTEYAFDAFKWLTGRAWNWNGVLVTAIPGWNVTVVQVISSPATQAAASGRQRKITR